MSLSISEILVLFLIGKFYLSLVLQECLFKVFVAFDIVEVGSHHEEEKETAANGKANPPDDLAHIGVLLILIPSFASGL